jgi:hypothetical protein
MDRTADHTRSQRANTTDVYAFVDQEGNQKSLVLALGVYPHQEPGIGPNKYNFDDNVLYEIHVALGPDVAAGRRDSELSSFASRQTSRTKTRFFSRTSAWCNTSAMRTRT